MNEIIVNRNPLPEHFLLFNRTLRSIAAMEVIK